MPRRRRRHRRRAALVRVLVALVCAVAVAVTVVVELRHDPVKDAGAALGYSATPPVKTVYPPERTLKDFIPLLSDRLRPVSIAVFSDATGSDIPGWVGQVATWIGAHYRRPVNVRIWSQRAGAYGAGVVRVYKGGHGQPVTIWKGASGGQNVPYVERNLAKLAPGHPDLAIVSEGHNEKVGAVVPDVTALLAAMHARDPGTIIVLILQNPDNPAMTRATKQVANVTALRLFAHAAHYDAVDVYGAFTRVKNWSTGLLDKTTGFHPNAAGYALWARIVEAAFTPARQ